MDPFIVGTAILGVGVVAWAFLWPRDRPVAAVHGRAPAPANPPASAPLDALQLIGQLDTLAKARATELAHTRRFAQMVEAQATAVRLPWDPVAQAAEWTPPVPGSDRPKA